MTDTSTRIEIPLEMLIKQADPDFYRLRRDQTEYVFSNGRRFGADPTTRGAYNFSSPFLVDDDGAFVTDESGGKIILE